MSKNFDVEMIAIAEYATQDFQNRGVLGGIFPGVINFDQRPAIWPSYYMIITIRPKTVRFDFSFYLFGPKKENIVTFKAKYDNTSPPDRRERIVFNSQVPPVPFAGPGSYYFGIMDSGKKVFEREYAVEVGATLPVKLGQVEIIEAPLIGNSS